MRRAFAALVGQIGPETDQMILRARASGERWVAGVRLFLVAGLSALVLAVAPAQRWTGLTLLLVVGLLHALLLAWLAFRVFEEWVPWLSCAADVTLTTAWMVFVLRHGGASAVSQARTFYELYFLVIMSAGMRYDWRLCIWTAGLCMVEHALLLLVLAGPLRLESPVEGGFAPTGQAVRFVLLGLGGIIMAAVAQRAKRLRLMVGVDHLTGLSQRAPFVERMDEELARARRRGAPLSVAILDLDGFKAFNDTFGHPVGDRALQLVATRLRSSVRKSDLVARFGGEEFVVAFPETEVEQARQRLEHIRSELALVSIQVGLGEHRQVTVSAGLGSWPADGETFDAVLTSADARLYEAKRRGKNRVVAPETPFLGPPPRDPPPGTSPEPLG
ncbi:MAG TPA: GGDEF domain-containing protein [Myxococcaceae bacterium]|nr:GGDEF domain-containing protein [Myxococcaceae bacterium]